MRFSVCPCLIPLYCMASFSGADFPNTLLLSGPPSNPRILGRVRSIFRFLAGLDIDLSEFIPYSPPQSMHCIRASSQVAVHMQDRSGSKSIFGRVTGHGLYRYRLEDHRCISSTGNLEWLFCCVLASAKYVGAPTMHCRVTIAWRCQRRN